MILKQIVSAEDAGRKIKFYVRSKMGVSYGQFSALKMRGGLHVNSEVVHANHILQEGEVVEVIIEEQSATDIVPDYSPVNIVYEDDDILIIDKPAPLACQASARKSEPALENRLAGKYGPAFVFRPLNRLDRGTSGLLCAAKHAHACQRLQKTLHTDDYLREYLAVVCGEMTGEGVIDLPIAKIDAASVKRVIDHENGRQAITHWHSEGVFGDYSLIRLKLETGRTHQIRVHMSATGHPIAGDFLYGTEIKELPGRFALHSARISLTQPITGERIDIESPLPEEIETLIKK